MTGAGRLTALWCWASIALTVAVLVGLVARLGAVALNHADAAGLGALWGAFAIGLGLSVAAVLVAALPAGAVAVALDELLPPGPVVRVGRAVLAVTREVPPLVIGLVAAAVGLGSGYAYAVLVLAAVALPRLTEGDRAALRLARRTERLAAASLGLSPLAIFVRVILPSTMSSVVASHVRAVGSTLGAAAPLLLVDPEVGALAIVAFRLAVDDRISEAAAAVLLLLVGVVLAHAVAVVLDRPARWRRVS